MSKKWTNIENHFSRLMKKRSVLFLILLLLFIPFAIANYSHAATPQIAGGNSQTLLIKSDGTLWAWGNNSNGQLGLGDTTDRHSPVQVGTDNNWVSIAAGFSHTIALKSNGTLWSWGFNFHGQLGYTSWYCQVFYANSLKGSILNGFHDY